MGGTNSIRYVSFGLNKPPFSLLNSNFSINRRLSEYVPYRERHGMQGFIHGRLITPKEDGDSKKKIEDTTLRWKRSDALVI
ncbi:unnamed protein product [Lactuca virosa]|uniref:Uncharacterized protein n=1 Tax=Lactuca virosa TaxID=75947 RepID=A0AAU9NR15_9ASTR|nr:unnamed protein product [Lactuca virosa]